MSGLKLTAQQRCGVVVIFTAKPNLMKPELWFLLGSNPASDLSKI